MAGFLAFGSAHLPCLPKRLAFSGEEVTAYQLQLRAQLRIWLLPYRIPFYPPYVRGTIESLGSQVRREKQDLLSSSEP